MEKKKLQKISLSSFEDEIKVISKGQQSVILGGSVGCACCICNPGTASDGLGGSIKASRKY